MTTATTEARILVALANEQGGIGYLMAEDVGRLVGIAPSTARRHLNALAERRAIQTGPAGHNGTCYSLIGRTAR